MKTLLLLTFLVCIGSTLTAQHKDNVFADVGINNGSWQASATYNYKFKGHWGIGGGAQIRTPDGIRKVSVFADFRKYWIKNKRAWLFLVDPGFDFFKDHPQPGYFSADNAVYTAVGFGYCRFINERGSGIYATFRLAIDSRTIYGTEKNGRIGAFFNADATPVLAIGFKF